MRSRLTWPRRRGPPGGNRPFVSASRPCLIDTNVFIWIRDNDLDPFGYVGSADLAICDTIAAELQGPLPTDHPIVLADWALARRMGGQIVDDTDVETGRLGADRLAIRSGQYQIRPREVISCCHCGSTTSPIVAAIADRADESDIPLRRRVELAVCRLLFDLEYRPNPVAACYARNGHIDPDRYPGATGNAVLGGFLDSSRH